MIPLQAILASLRSEKDSQLMTVSSLKKRLTELELKEEDDIRELEMERSLLIGEWNSESENLVKVSFLSLRLEQVT